MSPIETLWSANNQSVNVCIVCMWAINLRCLQRHRFNAVSSKAESLPLSIVRLSHSPPGVAIVRVIGAVSTSASEVWLLRLLAELKLQEGAASHCSLGPGAKCCSPVRSFPQMPAMSLDTASPLISTPLWLTVSLRGILDLYFWSLVYTVPSPFRCVKRMETVQG